MSDTEMRNYAARLTSAIAYDLANNRQPPASVAVHPPFPPTLGADERFWAAGQFRLQEFSATGDGRYEYNSFWAGSLSPLGLLLLACTFGLSGANKRRARREAERAATPHWHDIDQGTLAVTRYGMYLHTNHGVFPWAWSSLTSADLPEPGILQFTGRSDNGTAVSWLVISEWAELAFVTWALTCHPQHPKFKSWWEARNSNAVATGDRQRLALP